jgi:hypothetical protein
MKEIAPSGFLRLATSLFHSGRAGRLPTAADSRGWEVGSAINYQTSGGSCGAACPNNSGPQGEIFYDQLSASNGGGVSGYIITGIQQCVGAEGVAGTGSYDPDLPNQSESGKTAIEKHMTTNCQSTQ